MTLHFYEAQTARKIMAQVIDRIPYGSYVVLSVGQLEGDFGEELRDSTTRRRSTITAKTI